MKYYIYISDQKVDMLASQIPEKKLKELVRRLQVSVGVPWLPLNVTYKPGEPLPSDSKRIERLQVVVSALEGDDMGDPTSTRPWIKGSLNMAWGFIDAEKQSVWFLGEVGDLSLVMGGSARHLLGGAQVQQQPHHAYSLLPMLTEALLERARADDEQRDTGQSPNLMAAARLLISTANGPRERLSFIARRLVMQTHSEGTVVLATPLYVESEPI